MDRAAVVHLWRGQVTFGVPSQLLGEDEQTVERRPQLVRHVGQEFRLVLGGAGQLFGLLLQCPLGLFHLPVLAFNLILLLIQQAGFHDQFLVGCCSTCCWLCSSLARSCDCESSLSVRVLAPIVFRTMPMPSVSCSRKV